MEALRGVRVGLQIGCTPAAFKSATISGMRSAQTPGQVRIIGGQWRRTRLPVALRDGLRPTPDRTRETVFNWLQPTLAGARVLDVFAGSGALGLEAVSRGAREAYLVERDPALARSLRETVARLPGGEAVQVVQADALNWLAAPLHGRFDLVFLDPPFAGDLWRPALAALPPWLADEAWLYLETPPDCAMTPGPDWHLHREGHSRQTRYALYRRD